MLEIRYKDNLEVADIAGRTVAEAREQFRAGFGVTDKAAAFLNGKKITPEKETAVVLHDDDTLVFKMAGVNRLAYVVGAMLLALAVTGGVFAYGFTNATATMSAAVVTSDFASVSANTSNSPSWTVRGMQKGSTGSGTLFDIDTNTSGYTGDFAATVTLANADDLIGIYRNLNLSIEVRDSANNLVDINGDGNADSKDFVLLTLDNGSVTLNIEQSAGDVYTVKLNGGYYSCNMAKSGWTSGDAAPLLYCEVAQK